MANLRRFCLVACMFVSLLPGLVVAGEGSETKAGAATAPVQPPLQPVVNSPAAKPAASKPTRDPAAKPVRAKSVEERLEELETTNQELLKVVRELAIQNEALKSRIDSGQQQPAEPTDRSLEGGVDSIENPVPVPPEPESTGPADLLAPSPTIPPATAATRSAPAPSSQPLGLDRSLEGGIDSIENPVPGDKNSWKDGRVKIGPGFMLESKDGEYQLQFHHETQVEARIYQQGGMYPAASNFDVPRARLIFNGRMTKNMEFDVSVEGGYGNLNLLNAWLNFKARGSDQFMIKAGRMKMPYMYEWYAMANPDFMTPERSMFALNYGLGRAPGLMAWGSVLDKRMDYAVGIFNGPRNQYTDFNNSKDISAYLNFKPFLKAEGLAFLKNLNVGASMDAGSQNNPVFPLGFKTSVGQGNNVVVDTVAPSFFNFNPGVNERGWRSLGDLHFAYFYKQLSVIGEWSGGYTHYGFQKKTPNYSVPSSGYYVSAGYFLTGEQVERRTQVKPKHNFSLQPGKVGFGAWELVGRYSTLNIGNEVFTSGLADSSKWANGVGTVDLGLNWYWNPYTKVYLFWEHAEFNQPATYNSLTNAKQINSDLFWMRFQLYF